MLKNIWTKMLLSILILMASLASAAVLSATSDVPVGLAEFSTYSDAAYGWLENQQDSALLDDGTGISGLVDSFEDFSGPNQPITEAFTYDQAVAAIAFLVKGDFERARIVLTKLQNLQAED